MKPPEVTLRQLSVWRLIALGKSNAEIALALGITLATVKTHTERLYNAITAANRVEAAVLWHKLDMK